MNTPFKIVIIGTGNVAHHIANSISSKKNINLIQVFNHRLTNNAKSFSKKHNCTLVSNYSNINTDADFYIIAVTDDAIIQVAINLKKINLKGIIVHTSGSTNLNVLKDISKNIGVYYPLQTFSTNTTVNWATTPILIEANNTATLKKLKQLAASISTIVKTVNSPARLQLHLAAVFACNFTNALYAVAFDIVEKHLGRKETTLLMPLMANTLDKLNTTSPKKAQTGPAVRDDKKTIKKHLELLKDNKELTATYKLLSNLIMQQKQYSN